MPLAVLGSSHVGGTVHEVCAIPQDFLLRRWGLFQSGRGRPVLMWWALSVLCGIVFPEVVALKTDDVSNQ